MKNNIKHNEKGKEVKNKPLIEYFTHISDLNIDSKKQIASFNNEGNNSYLKNRNIFNIRNENINGIDISNHEEENQFLNSEYININKNNIMNKSIKNSNNPFNLNKESESEVMRKKKINNNMINITQQQNKKILKNQKKQKKTRKNKKKQRNTARSYSIINNNLNKSNINSKRNKSSQHSDRSGNSTKRTNYILRTHDTPEKYPDDYLTVDSSSDEEKEVKKNSRLFL